MKHVILIILTAFLFTEILSQTYNLTVVNGYGSGNYQAGDTVHVWSEKYNVAQTFSHWSGDSQYLEMPNEWHTTLIMPSQNISVTAVINNMPSYTINFEQIMGVNNLKNVFSYFPSNLKGVIYLFHGTSSVSSVWINSVEFRSFVNAAIADDFGIIVTDAEEITLNTDLNGDGKLRWHFSPVDTINNIDYLNIKIITDTFVNRGSISPTTPKFSVGMSSGGAFSSGTSFVYNYVAGVSYCASSVPGISNIRNNPFAIRMAKYDDNDPYPAWQSDSILTARGICHDFKIHDRQPLYPERFARIPGISITTSQAIFNDLMINGQLDGNNYALNSDTIENNIITNPSLYPNIISLSASLQQSALNQIKASNAEHYFFSDYNFATLDFFNSLCSPLSLNE